MTKKERILRVAKGEMVDKIPYVPRIDLWHNANVRSGTLPARHRGRSADEISRSEGWALHKIVPEFDKPAKPEDTLHRGIGLYRLKEYLFDFAFSDDVEITVKEEFSEEEDMTRVTYYTPKGQLEVLHGFTKELKEAGSSISWIKEHAIKGPEDYKVLAHIFSNLKVTPDYETFKAWQKGIGEDGVAVGSAMAIACSSPMHYIQKTFLDSTQFYLHYGDYPIEMGLLAEALSQFYDRVLRILADSPAEMILWSANVDEMVTHPPYFEKEIMPWCQKAADILHPEGKLLIMHPDGENKGLMELIPRCHIDVAEAVTPYPMTKVTIDEYYEHWCRPDKLTLWGGIPESLLLEKSATSDDLKAYLDNMFKAVRPGKRLIAGIGDTTPPGADFERLVYIGERFEKEGRLSAEAGALNALGSRQIEDAMVRVGGSPKSTPVEASELMGSMMGNLLASAGTISQVLEELSQGFRRLSEIGQELHSPGEKTESTSGSPSKTGTKAAEFRQEDAPEPAGPFEILKKDILSGDEKKIVEDVRQMVAEGLSPDEMINQGMLPAMEVIGGKFKDGTVFIPEVLRSARAMNAAVEFLQPYLVSEDRKSRGKILIGTVKGDMHDIGKNICIAMFKGVGFEVIDLGVNVPLDEFVAQVKEHKPDILGISALLTTTMPQMGETIKAIQEAGLREKVKVFVGGAPVNQKFATEIGADGYAVDAGQAVELAKSLIAG